MERSRQKRQEPAGRQHHPADQTSQTVARELAFTSGHRDRVFPTHLAISVALLGQDRLLKNSTL